MVPAGILETFPPLLRLALAYSPKHERSQLLVLFALDRRLGSVVRASREPMLAQLRLAWWREQLGVPPALRPEGEPLLGVLSQWRGPDAILAGLVDGWEGMTGPAPLPLGAFEGLANARAAGFACLAAAAHQDAALRMGRNWALADIAAHLGDPRERQAALDLARAQDWRWQRLPRGLRTLAVLHGLAARTIWSDDPSLAITPRTALAAMRIGTLGR